MKPLTMLAGGDIILGEDSAAYFSGVAEALKNADIRLGQLEVMYGNDIAAYGDLHRELTNLEPLKDFFDVLTLSGNHMFDGGTESIAQTLGWLDQNQIPHTGGGMNQEEAERPVIMVKEGIRFGFLNFNCTGPKAAWAGPDKAGGAYVEISTQYDLGDVANPGGPPTSIKTSPEVTSFCSMIRQIEALRLRCDILTVYFHKGLVHKPAKLAEYEKLVSYAAIDAGADVVFASHAHLLRGVELYKGKAIYHGLNNFIAWVPSLRPDFKAQKGSKTADFDPEGWACKRMEMFGFVPDGNYPTYPFHPQAVYTIAALCHIEEGKIVRNGFLPAIVGKDGITRIVSRKEGGQEVLAYMETITRQAGLNGVYQWAGDEIIVGEG